MAKTIVRGLQNSMRFSPTDIGKSLIVGENLEVITGSGTGGANSEIISQVAHGFLKYDAIRHDGTTFVKSIANNQDTSDVVGIVSAVADTDTFTVTYSGLIEWNTPGTPDFTLGSDVWLSNATLGEITAVELTYVEGDVRQYVGEALPSGLFVNIDIGNYIGEGGGGGAQTEDVVQASHGFAKYDVIRHDGTFFVGAQADSESNAQAVGIVSDVADTDNFTVTYGGLIEWDAPPTPDYALGSRLWLDNGTVKTIVTSKPTLTDGEVEVVIGTATTGGLLVEIDKGENIVYDADWYSEVGKTADYTVLAADAGKLIYVEDTVTTNITFTFDAGFPDNGVVFFYMDSSNFVGGGASGEVCKLIPNDGTNDLSPIYKGDRIVRFTKSNLIGGFNRGNG
jgi:hypothetical protein